MNQRPQSLLDSLLGAAVTLLVVALLLTWAWELLEPLRPVLLGAAIVYGYFRWQARSR